MNKNMSFEHSHEKLGKLQINIYANSNESEFLGVSSIDIQKCESMDTMDFFQLLTEKNSANERLCEIISDVLLDCIDKGLSNQQLYFLIVNRYSKSFASEKKNTKNGFVIGEGINMEIVRETDPENPIFTLTSSIQSSDYEGLQIDTTTGKIAFIHDNSTNEDCRKMGIQTRAFALLEKYFSYNGINYVALKAQSTAEDEKTVDLVHRYISLGYELQVINGENYFVKNIYNPELFNDAETDFSM